MITEHSILTNSVSEHEGRAKEGPAEVSAAHHRGSAAEC